MTENNSTRLLMTQRILSGYLEGIMVSYMMKQIKIPLNRENAPEYMQQTDFKSVSGKVFDEIVEANDLRTLEGEYFEVKIRWIMSGIMRNTTIPSGTAICYVLAIAPPMDAGSFSPYLKNITAFVYKTNNEGEVLYMINTSIPKPKGSKVRARRSIV